jgi:hypothetical protein
MNKKTTEQVQAGNLRAFMEDGPRLSRRYGMFVVARDRQQGMVLLGGLGAVGVGQMWRPDDGSDKDYPGYDDAPEQTCREQSALDNAMHEHELMNKQAHEPDHRQ